MKTPNKGGSYIRQDNGSLKRVEAAPPKEKKPAAKAPAKPVKGKDNG